ncbi:MAG: SDR family NAD(P)-dependent oxidoreductase [Dehalococcoidia bacterium]|jgi:3-oxoacyl-[acyl-carrier protein] reductase
MDLHLKGKNALVTGTALQRGVGRAIALTLADEGANVICADINGDGAKSISQEVESKGVRSLALTVDQGEYSQVQAAVQKALVIFETIHILVNNAALTTNLALGSEMDVTKWRRDIDVNLSGPYYWIREVFPNMTKQKWGRIINISSVTALMGSRSQVSYASSKGGLISMIKTFAMEGGKYGITANAICPGAIATDPMLTLSPDILERHKRRAAIRRLAEPEDIANLAAFLASDKSGYITGEFIVIDGGQQLYTW